MEITFRRRKTQREFGSAQKLKRAYGTQAARQIALRMAVLRHAPNLAAVPTTKPERRHQLSGNRKGQFAVDAGAKLRVVFEPDHEEIPMREDGGIDTERITAIRILAAEDYHN